MFTASREETTIEQVIAERAAILTGIGMGTAFSLLIMLIVMITVVRGFSDRVLARSAERAAVRAAQVEVEVRERALAAAIAVTALLASPRRARFPGGDDG